MRLSLILLSLILGPILQAQEEPYFKALGGMEKERGDFWRPTISLLLPGFDQYTAGHFGSGFAYTSLFFLGREWTDSSTTRVKKFEDSVEYQTSSTDEKENFRNHKTMYQEQSFSSQFQLVARGISAYHSFRTSVESRRHLGQYKFLPKNLEETPVDIAMAPFEFSFLKRSTTLVPLGVIATLSILNHGSKTEGNEKATFSSSDLGYTMGLSYNAGTNEEAIFRGWMMPFAREYTGSYFFANLIQSSIFAAAHLNQTEVPIIQLGLGYYLGWLTERNNWSISESIFIHAWWDVFAFAMQYSTQKETAVLMLPPLSVAF